MSTHPATASTPIVTNPAAPAEKTTWQYLKTGISAGIFALTTALAALVIGLPAAVGGMPLTVLSGSMEPVYSPGDLIVVKPTPVEDIRIGDIITYQERSGDPTRITHRVITRTTTADGTTTFTTQGDANPTPDGNPVTEVQIVGTLWYHVPALGWIAHLITGDTRSWLVPAVSTGLFLYAAVTFVSYLRDRTRTT